MLASLEHAQDEDLERYSIGTLSGFQGEAFEEHLLICPACQDRLAEVDAYVQTVRLAASRLRLKIPLSVPRTRRGYWGFFSQPVLAVGATAAACLILAVWVSRSRPSPSSSGLPPVTVLLQTARGPSGAIDARAPRGRPLILRADLSGLQPQAVWELEVVDARGVRVQRSSGAAFEGKLEAQLATGLTAGQYWVRLYASGAGSEPLREYALRVE